MIQHEQQNKAGTTNQSKIVQRIVPLSHSALRTFSRHTSPLKNPLPFKSFHRLDAVSITRRSSLFVVVCLQVLSHLWLVFPYHPTPLNCTLLSPASSVSFVLHAAHIHCTLPLFLSSVPLVHCLLMLGWSWSWSSNSDVIRMMVVIVIVIFGSKSTHFTDVNHCRSRSRTDSQHYQIEKRQEKEKEKERKWERNESRRGGEGGGRAMGIRLKLQPQADI